MIADIIFFTVIWNLMGVVCLLAWVNNSTLYFDEILNPFKLYKEYKVNIFGLILLTLFINLLCPLYTIGFWFYKLCTIGRKD